MRVGSICYATDSGLGILCKDFYDHGVVNDVMVVRHGTHPTHDEWYPRTRHRQLANLKSAQQVAEARQFCGEHDVMLFFETPFIWDLLPWCRQHGIKTALMPMYECEFPRLPAEPDLIINPSHLDQQYYPQGIYIPVPVEYPWQQRTLVEVFIHNAGHGGLRGRNGTQELLESLQFVQSPIKLIFRCQSHSRDYARFWGNARPNVQVEMVQQTIPREQLFSEGDVFIFPEKFNGLSLPLQEARAAGMLVMCGDRFPMNQWLPHEPLIPVAGHHQASIGPPYNRFEEAEFNPRAIAAHIDRWYGRDITEYSLSGKRWAAENSWTVLGPRYRKELEALCA